MVIKTQYFLKQCRFFKRAITIFSVRLNELETLDIENNHIKQVPEALENLPRLKVFKANGNSISQRTLRRLGEKFSTSNSKNQQGEAYNRLQKYYQSRLTQNRDTNRLFMNVILSTQFQTADFRTGWSSDK